MFSLALLGVSLAVAGDGDVEASLWRGDAGPVHVLWAPDLAIMGAGFGGYLLLRDLGGGHAGAVSDPHGLDAIGQPTWSPRAGAASDFFGHALKYKGLNMPVLSMVGVGVFGGLRHGAGVASGLGAGSAYFLVSIEALALNLGVTEALKVGVGRPRPYTSVAFQEAYPEVYASEEVQETFGADSHGEAYKSWPSGHTSSSAATSFCAATLIWRDLRASGAPPWVAGLSYGAATALTATTGFLRVKAGWHHTTDVVSGGVLGAAIGTGVALWHTTGALQPSVARSEDGAPTLSVGGVW